MIRLLLWVLRWPLAHVCEIVIALVILYAMFSAGYAHCEEPCEGVVSFDTAYVPDEMVERIDGNIRWVLNEFPGITACAEVEIRRVPLAKDLYATHDYTPFGHKVQFGDLFMSQSDGDMRTVLLHELRHVNQVETEDEGEESTDCRSARREIDATSFEIDHAKRTGMSPRMMMETLTYLRDQRSVARRLCQ